MFLVTCIGNIWLIIFIFDIRILIYHVRGNNNHVTDLLSSYYSGQTVDDQLLSIFKYNCQRYYYYYVIIPAEVFYLDLAI